MDGQRRSGGRLGGGLCNPWHVAPRARYDCARMRVDYELTEDDIGAFAAHHFKSVPIGCFMFGLGAGCFLPYFGAALLFWLLGLQPRTPPQSPTPGGLECLAPFTGLAVALGVAQLWPRIPSYYSRRLARQQGLLGRCSAELRPEGLFATGPTGDGTRLWHAITRVEATSSQLLFYYSEDPRPQAVAIPRRAFPDTAAAEAFLAEAKRLHAAACGPASGR